MNKASPTFTTLSSVIADGDIVTLRSYLENDSCNPNESDEYGQTLLMVSAQHGQMAIVNELISQGADVNAEDSDNWSALMNAAKAGHNDIVIKLLDHGAFIEKRDMGSWTPLMWACYKGHYDVVLSLLEHNAMVNVHDKLHCTCLIWAAGRGYFDIVNILLENGAKVNSGDKFGSSPLVWACRKGFTDIVRVLLEHGVNVDTAGMFSWTSLIVAAKGNHTAIVNMLLEHKPNVNAVDMDGCTALTTACKEGYIEIAVALMNAGAYINLQDRNGDTNLIHAAKGGHFSIVDVFLKKYADVDLPGSERKTALYWAVEKGYPDIVRLLLAANPNMESPTKDGDTPLLKATRIRNAEIVQLLVDKKCKVSVTDKKGDSALHIAMRARSKAIVEILLRNPKNSQLLYRPNRAGETPYNIDTNHKKSILAQIFGARRLNTNEDSENRLGYDLYSSALADILSEPSLSMPISVGLYAKWGSGKSFLLNKLENEMRNFAIQWLDPSFEFSWLVFAIVTTISLIFGFVTSVASHMWIAGIVIAASIFVFSFVFLGAVIYVNKRYYWSKFSKISNILATQLNSLRTLLFVIFCNPPAKRGNTVSDPVKFLFTEQTKVTSSGNDNSIVQIVISLHAAIEKEYGFLTSRLYRVFRPKAVQAQKWQWRRLCCIPNFIITIFVFGCILSVLALLFINSDAHADNLAEHRTVVHSLLISIGCIVSLILVSNLYTWMRLLAALIISHQRRIARNLALLESSHTMNYITSLKSEVDMIVQMVQCLDAFTAQQTRLVVIVDGLDSCEQEKVLHVLDAVHLLFSDVSAPFLTVLAIDPHIIIKAIESNINRVFHNTSISGHEYLRNVVHLPFYLQNSGLRRVKAAQQAAIFWAKKSASCWNEDRECDRAVTTVSASRKASNSSISVPENFRKRTNKGSQKLKASDSMASSISNLHRVVLGAQDLTKVLLTDDYFSDVNPRSMRRLMNIVYVTGRLLKAFTIDFNWYHLASWVNITEQWPYRTSWIIMYYEMHENELDEMMSLKCIYEKIKDYMPTSKEDDPSLDLDHDERKFKVFLSFHSSNLLINDLKIFLPFTINLDPYIRKIIQEDNQAASEILKTNLKPSNQPNAKSDAAKWVQTQPQVMPKKSILASTKVGDQIWGPMTPSLVPLNDKNAPQYHVTIGAPMMTSPPSHYPNLTPWWNPPAENYRPYTSHATSSKLYSQVLPNGQKLSSLSVDDVLSLLSTLEKIDQKRLQSYANTLKENNIGGQVLFTCELKELKEVLNMSFGDWELFRVLILSLREEELSNGNLPTDNSNQGLIHGPLPPQTLVSHRSSPSGCDSPDLKKKDRSGNGVAKLTAESLESRSFNRGRSISTVLEKQPLPSYWEQVLNKVTMEESMIVGALETLNEEALEDALEEKLGIHRDSNTVASGITSNPLSPIISDPEEQMLGDLSDSEKMDQHPVAYTLNSPSEVDVMYLKNVRDSPMLHVSAASLCDSVTDLETASVGHTQHFQPIIDSRFSPGPLLRTPSNSSESISYPSTKSIGMEKPKPKNLPSRPSSLVYDGTCPVTIKKQPSIESESSTTKTKTAAVTSKSSLKSHDKLKQISQSITKRRSSKKKKYQDKRDNSTSSSSTETEELLLQPAKKSLSVPEKVASPQSEADGFYSDDEHTPLVSPFHSNKSSQYNLQSALKHDKESTPEKVMPKQQSEVSGCLKLRKPLERQFSMDNFLSDRARLSVSDIQESLSASSYSGHPEPSSHGLPVYDQHVADTPSPETQTSEKSDSNINLHTETIL